MALAPGCFLRAGIDGADVILVRPDLGGGVGEDERHLAVCRLIGVRRRDGRRRRTDGAATVDVDVLVLHRVLHDDAVAVQVAAHGPGADVDKVMSLFYRGAFTLPTTTCIFIFYTLP